MARACSPVLLAASAIGFVMFETEDTGGEDEDEGVELPRPNCRLLFLPQHRTSSAVERKGRRLPH